MEDTPVFQAIERTEQVERTPVRDALRYYWKEMLCISALSALQGLTYYMLSGYMVTYLIETIGLGPTTALLSNMVALGLLTVLIPLGGLLGDRVGRRPMMFAGCAVVALFSVSAFLIAGSGGLASAILAQVMLILGMVGSTGGSNGSCQCSSRGAVAEGLARTAVELQRDRVELMLVVI